MSRRYFGFLVAVKAQVVALAVAGFELLEAEAKAVLEYFLLGFLCLLSQRRPLEIHALLDATGVAHLVADRVRGAEENVLLEPDQLDHFRC